MTVSPTARRSTARRASGRTRTACPPGASPTTSAATRYGRARSGSTSCTVQRPAKPPNESRFPVFFRFRLMGNRGSARHAVDGCGCGQRWDAAQTLALPRRRLLQRGLYSHTDAEGESVQHGTARADHSGAALSCSARNTLAPRPCCALAAGSAPRRCRTLARCPSPLPVER